MGSDSGGNVETAEGLTREAENIGSEAYAQKRETLEEEWQKCYGVLEEKYLQLMNRNICLHTGEGWEELKSCSLMRHLYRHLRKMTPFWR